MTWCKYALGTHFTPLSETVPFAGYSWFVGWPLISFKGFPVFCFQYSK